MITLVENRQYRVLSTIFDQFSLLLLSLSFESSLSNLFCRQLVVRPETIVFGRTYVLVAFISFFLA